MKKAAFLVATVMMVAGLACGADDEKTFEIESILADAQSIYLTPAAPARAGRLVALSKYLASLQPTDVNSLRFLCEIDTSRGLFDKAENYAGKIFDAQPTSYQAACRWLKFEIDDRQTAPARIELLESIAQNPKYADAFRAHAQTQLAGLYNAQGDSKKATQAINTALQLDPTNDEALMENLAMAQNPSNLMKVQTLLEMLRHNPRDWAVSRDLAVLLNSLGLPEQAAKYYSLAWSVASNGENESKMSPDIAIGYINAMLSDSKPEKVISTFSGRLKEFRDVPMVLELYVEALKASGASPAAIIPVVEQLKDAYKSRMNQIAIRANINPILDAGRKNSPELADAILQLGIFYLTTADMPELAAEEFKRAKLFGAKDDIVEMLQSAIELKKSDAKAAVTIEKYAKNSAYANLLLAEYFAQIGNTEKEQKFITKGLDMGYGTRASRAMRALWKSSSPLPQSDDIKKIAAILNGFDAQVLYMATNPKDFVKVTAAPVGAPIVSPGEPIFVKVTITNIGQLPISFGDSGMLDTQVGISVTSPAKTEIRFYTTPSVTLPVGKYLKPGESVSGTTRVDTAQIAWYLSSNPIATVRLNIKACVNPVWDSKGYVQSMLPMIEPGTMTFYRAGLLATGKLDRAGSPEVNLSASWYNQVLGAMNETLAGKSLKDRVRTARQIASLISYSRALEGGLAELPRELSGVFSLPPIMALAATVMQDKSPIVRAELISSMNNIPTITPEIINLVGPAFQDPSTIVRLKLVELLGNVGGKGNMDALEMFASDKNEYVSTMAKAFIFYEKNRREKPAAGQTRQ